MFTKKHNFQMMFAVLLVVCVASLAQAGYIAAPAHAAVDYYVRAQSIN
jgi:hypothetical protein